MCEISYGLLDEKLSLQSWSIEDMQKSSKALLLLSKVVFSISDLWEKSFISVVMVKLSENYRINSRLNSRLHSRPNFRLNSRPNYRLNNHRDQEFFEKCWALSTSLDQRNKVSEFCLVFSVTLLPKMRYRLSSTLIIIIYCTTINNYLLLYNCEFIFCDWGFFVVLFWHWYIKYNIELEK